MMIETTKLYILMTLAFIQGQSCMSNQKLCLFSPNLGIDLDEIQYVATTCWSFEANAIFLFLHKWY